MGIILQVTDTLCSSACLTARSAAALQHVSHVRRFKLELRKKVVYTTKVRCEITSEPRDR